MVRDWPFCLRENLGEAGRGVPLCVQMREVVGPESPEVKVMDLPLRTRCEAGLSGTMVTKVAGLVTLCLEAMETV